MGRGKVAWHAPAVGQVQRAILLSPASPLELAAPQPNGAQHKGQATLLAHLDVLLGGVVAEGLVAEHNTCYAEAALR
ncbi:MAG: hypothetical protein M3220_10520 [Chloroflexota bacterium]|nr:hypothetical protein [Chloroflexota bacterium]